jgi:hypothetical protein
LNIRRLTGMIERLTFVPGKRRSLMNRRRFIQGAGQFAGVGLIAPLIHVSPTTRAAHSPGRIMAGQIGTAHAHAAGKMATLRKLRDYYDVVGIAEPDPERRSKLENHSAYRGLKWISEEQLLNTPGLEAVAVETDIPELVPTAVRCVSAGVHIHLDKPAGLSLIAFRKLLDEAAHCVQETAGRSYPPQAHCADGIYVSAQSGFRVLLPGGAKGVVGRCLRGARCD